MAFQPVTGHCQCGTVHFRMTKPAQQLYHCHCSMCRRVHGTLFATYAVGPRDGFTLTKGADNLGSFASSPGTIRKFCKSCGCPIYIDVPSKPDLIWLMPGIMDGHPGHPSSAERHIFVDSKVEWYDFHATLPEHTEGTASPVRA